MSIFAVSLNSSPARCGRPPRPAEAKLSLPGCALARAIEFSHVVGGDVAGHHQHLRHRHHQRDRRKIPGDVVRDFFHRGVDDERARAHDPDGVAVGRRLRDRIGAQHPGLSAAILDHHRLFCQFRHALADDPRDDVVGAAGRERHDQLDGFVGKSCAAASVGVSSSERPATSVLRILIKASSRCYFLQDAERKARGQQRTG